MPDNIEFNTPTGEPYSIRECVLTIQQLEKEGHLTLGEVQSLIYYLTRELATKH